MNAVDLHVHSNQSDGTFSPSQLVDLALEKKLTAFALTDHDTIAGLCEATAYAKNKNLEVVPGIELSTEYFGKDIHILGLYINPFKENFLEQLTIFQNSRVARNQKMCQKLKEQGIDISYEKLTEEFPDSVITRAHYARFLFMHGYVKSMKEAFEKYVGDHCSAFVPREKITPVQAVALILSANGIPVLAHPILYRFSNTNLETLVSSLKEAGLIGIEAVYSTYAPSEERDIKRLALKYNLLLTGGSDFHGQNKPDISLGTGLSHLFIPQELLDRLKAFYCQRLSVQSNTKSMLFFDLDGTLLNDDKIISPATKAALDICAKSHQICFSTGRPMQSLLKLVTSLEINYPNLVLSSFNGGLVYDYSNQKNLIQKRLDTQSVNLICTLARKMKIHFHSYSDNAVLSERITPELEFYTSFVHVPYKIVKDVALEEAPYKILAVSLSDHNLLEELSLKIKEKLNEKVQCVFSNEQFLEILPISSGKGAALEYLCEYCRISKEQSYAFADADNDISMFQSAGHSVAMLNASDKVKAEADFVTFSDNNHDGLVPFLNVFSSGKLSD